MSNNSPMTTENAFLRMFEWSKLSRLNNEQKFYAVKITKTAGPK